MAEYIERGELIATITGRAVAKYPMSFGPGLYAAVDVIRGIRPADVAPVVHGRWVQVICHVEFEDGFVDRLYECCSRCHTPNGRKTSDYCPNCGARMDGE